MYKPWFARFFKGPSHICYVEEGDGGTGGSGGGGVGFKVADDDDGATPDEGGSPTGDTGGAGGDPDAGGDDDGDDDTPRYTKKDVSRMIQGRLQDDKYRKTLERIAQRAGVSVDELVNRLDTLEQQKRNEQIEKAAERAGVNPAVLRLLMNTHLELQGLKRSQQLAAMRNNPKDFPGLDKIEDKVIDKAHELNIPYTDAYWIVAGPTRINQAVKEAEHRAANNRQKLAGKDRVQGDTSSQMGVQEREIPDEVKRMARMAGMRTPEEIEEYYDAMQSENIDDYRERKAKRASRRKLRKEKV